MNAIELIDSFSEFKELKNIDRVTMMRIVEDVFRSTQKRKYGSDENVDVIINPESSLCILPSKYKHLYKLEKEGKLKKDEIVTTNDIEPDNNNDWAHRFRKTLFRLEIKRPNF